MKEIQLISHANKALTRLPALPRKGIYCMQFNRINTTSVADAISQEIKSLILGGSLKPGEKLPSERSLAKEFDVSRMSLRQGVALLVDIGLLEARKDGTYVCDVISPSLVEPFSQLFSWYPKSLSDMLSLRLLLQSHAIKLAIDKSSSADHEVLAFFYERMEKAFSIALETGQHQAAFDAAKELHLAIIDCSYNLVLATVLRGILSLLHSTLREDITKDQLKKYQFVQECLYKAIILGDKAIAQDMLERHIDLLSTLTRSKDNGLSKEQSDLSYRIDRTVARIEHLLVCQHFEMNQPLSELEQLAKEVDESEDVLNLALKVLIDKGTLQVDQKQLFIAPHASAPLVSDPLAQLINTDWRMAVDVFELRIILEESSAFYAAKNTNSHKLERLQQCLERLLTKGEVYDAHSNALDDYEFHLAIADLSENLATTYLMRGLFNLLRATISSWLSLFTEEVGDISIIESQHIAVCKSIQDSDPEAAKAAMRDHLQFVVTTIETTAARKERESYAQQRLRYIQNTVK